MYDKQCLMCTNISRDDSRLMLALLLFMKIDMARRRGNRADETVTPPDLTQVVTDLQRQITEQQQVITALMN